MIGSNSNGLRINLFGDSFPGQYTSGCRHFKMFAKTPDTPKNPSYSFIVILLKRSLYERLCSASTFLFPGPSRLHATLPSCCSDPLIWVPVSLVTYVALVLKPSCPVSLLTLSYSMCQPFSLSWTFGWDYDTNISLFSCLPTLSPHLPYCCSNHNMISFFSQLKWDYCLNFQTYLGCDIGKATKTTQIDKNPNFAVFAWWVLLALHKEKPGVNGNQGQKVKTAPSPLLGADKNVNRCN